MVKWHGLFKVRIVKTFGTDKQNCLVEALENYSNIKKGEQWITRRENLEAKKRIWERECIIPQCLERATSLSWADLPVMCFGRFSPSPQETEPIKEIKK